MIPWSDTSVGMGLAPSEVKTQKKREGNRETGSGLRRGHSGSVGSSSPTEEGKQILITSSTSHTKNLETQRRRHRLQQLMKSHGGAHALGTPQRAKACF